MNTPRITIATRQIYPGDLLDNALDKLRTAHLALAPENKGWHDDTALFSIWATLESVIRDLQPVRDLLQIPEEERQL